MTRFILALTAATALFAASVAAQPPHDDDQSGQSERRRRGPPPEAIEACVDLLESDPCLVETPEGDLLEGTCAAGPREDLPLACRPAGHERRGRPERGERGERGGR